MNDELAKHYLETALIEFRSMKKLAERALDQLNEAEFFVTLDPESNSIAILVKHMAGNMRSRWVDFLTSDGEKPDRNRDQEFVLDDATTREQVMQWWEQGWQHVFQYHRWLHRLRNGMDQFSTQPASGRYFQEMWKASLADTRRIFF